MGRYCNQACIHCHVESGPTRTEMMSRHTVDAVLRFFQTARIPTLDITGGAPELNPHFDHLVESAVHLGRHVMDRCNLTITQLPNYADLPEFLAAHEVEVVASLPSVAARQTDAQRGEGVFEEEREARGDRLAFSSGIVRDVLYGALSRRKRRSLHRKYAELLETRYAGRLERSELYEPDLALRVRAILANDRLAVGDLAGHLDPASRLVLVRRLVREGLLETSREQVS